MRSRLGEPDAPLRCALQPFRLDLSTVSRHVRALEDGGYVGPRRGPERPACLAAGPHRRRPRSAGARRSRRRRGDRSAPRSTNWSDAGPHDPHPPADPARGGPRILAQSTSRRTDERHRRSRPTSHEPTTARRTCHRQILVVMSGLMLGMLLAALDQTIVVDGAAHHRRRARRARAPVVGRDRVPADRDRVDAAVREDLRPLRAPAGVPVRDLVFLIGSVLAGLSQNMGAADRLPGRPGSRRRRPHGPGLRDHRRRHPAARARSLPGLLRRRLGSGQRRRAAAGRLLRRPSRAGAGSSTSTCRSGSSRWSS